MTTGREKTRILWRKQNYDHVILPLIRALENMIQSGKKGLEATLTPLESLLSECGTSPVLRLQPQGCRSPLPSPGHCVSCCTDPSWGEKELKKDPKSLSDTATAFSQGWKTQSCLCSDCAQWAKRGVCGKVTSTLTFKNSASKKTQKTPALFTHIQETKQGRKGYSDSTPKSKQHSSSRWYTSTALFMFQDLLYT